MLWRYILQKGRFVVDIIGPRMGCQTALDWLSPEKKADRPPGISALEGDLSGGGGLDETELHGIMRTDGKDLL